ncbi:hypothetical protein E5676_scaffold1418G00200 [Cucumis melo var. makuwa]|uniref:Uncharacterized protein n=1 Tax=Cucumis melo var. makuwa TaxID=1194695 RepID=A0A5A7SXU6_CUCMM|nr:hypothetical protein E6C27_scaffold400G00840 [Cucumis melo var. makuwa]TYK02812.1 hypothetical protein E5676_scaffold1418G00200 [Cucumis melo var. makuwa]
MFSLCLNLFATNLALYLSTDPSGLSFFLKTHLQPIALHPRGKSTRCQVLLDSRESISSLIASCHKLASTDDNASVRYFGSSTLYISKSSPKSFTVLALLLLLGSGSTYCSGRVRVRLGLRRSSTNDDRRSGSALGDDETARDEGNPMKRRDDWRGLGSAQVADEIDSGMANGRLENKGWRQRTTDCGSTAVMEWRWRRLGFKRGN